MLYKVTALMKKTLRVPLFFVHVKTVVCQPGIRPLPDARFTGNLILNVSATRTIRDKFLLLRHHPVHNSVSGPMSSPPGRVY